MMERRRSDRRAGASRHPVIQTTLVFLTGLLVILCLLFIAHPVVFALIVSLGLYAVLTPAVDYFRDREWPRAKAAGVVMGLATVALILIAVLLYPLLMTQVHQISEQVAHLDQQLFTVLSNTNAWLISQDMTSIDAQQTTNMIIQRASEEGVATAQSMSDFFTGIAPSLLLIPLVTFFLLCDFLIFRNQVMQLLPNRHFELGWLIYIRAAAQLQSYIRGISIQSMIMASITTLGFGLAGVDYAPLLGIMIGLLNMIPFFGISLAKIPPVVAVLISSDPSVMQIVLALAVVMFAQAVDNSIVIPRIVAKAASLHPLTVMIGVMLGGYYFGFFGLILSVPVMFSFKVIYNELLRGLAHQVLNVRIDAQRQQRIQGERRG
ncbi:MAG: AI-2E family transporter [Mariprofundus sp.]|nr:AI-2E family transporter [Mariprofundus sp.]